MHALVTSQLDYCNAPQMRLPLKKCLEASVVQTAMARLMAGWLMGTCHSPVETTLLATGLFLDTIQSAGYKALYGLGPGYLKDPISLYTPAWVLRSLAEHLLWVPSVSEAWLVVTRERSFSMAVLILWNFLPREVRLDPSLLSFLLAGNARDWIQDII